MSKKIVLTGNGTAEFTEKKSRFISHAAKVATEDEARNFITDIRKRYWDATHNVYAFSVGENGAIQRSSDDGEPAGTAGKPVLEAIKGTKLSNVAVVVTRYFGGILLGTGGLVRAYGKSAQLALDAADKSYLVPACMVTLFMDYEILGKVENYLIRHNYAIDHIQYENNAAIFCCVSFEMLADFQRNIKEKFSPHVALTVAEEKQWLEEPYSR